MENQTKRVFSGIIVELISIKHLLTTSTPSFFGKNKIEANYLVTTKHGKKHNKYCVCVEVKGWEEGIIFFDWSDISIEPYEQNLSMSLEKEILARVLECEIGTKKWIKTKLKKK